ncbi:MAG TPA: hypothetical protein VGL99_01810, partial [Chloroflexota bacterium]
MSAATALVRYGVAFALLMTACSQAAPPAQPTAAPAAAANPTQASAGGVAPTTPPAAAAVAPTQPPVAASKPTSPPAAQPTTAPAAAAGKPTTAPAHAATVDWDKILAEANKEGKLVVAHSSLESNGRILEAFKDTFPSIKIER